MKKNCWNRKRLELFACLSILVLFVAVPVYAINVTVTSNPLWTNTGIVVTGGTYNIQYVSGLWTWEYPQHPLVDANGTAPEVVVLYDLWLTTANHGSLIGYVGSSDPNTLTQNDPAFFFVGDGPTIVTGATGTLWLGFNDDYTSRANGSNGLFDNVGSVTVAVSQTACVQPPSGLISWWPGDGNATDIVGGKDGILEAGATFASGLVGQAFSLNGSTAYVLTPLTLKPAIPVGTIECWVNLASLTSSSGVLEIAGTFGTGNGTDRLWIEMVGPAGGPGVDPGTFVVNTGVEVRNDIAVPFTLSVGAWKHVAVTFDYTAGVYQLYIDGVFQASSTGQRTIPTQNFRIGGVSSDFGQTFFFPGLIDEVSIYNRVLSASEIQAIFNAGGAGKCKLPTALCQNVTATAGPTCTATASIDNGSFDPNGDPVTLAQAPAGPYPLGTTTPVTLTVTDSKNPSSQSQCTGTVTVQDKTSPVITMASVNPSLLWPPNHKMVDVTVTYTSTDNCSSQPICAISGVTSNEPISSSDYSIVDAHHVKLSADRSGSGNGRMYTITITCKDAAGLSSSQAVTVNVPHDQGK